MVSAGTWRGQVRISKNLRLLGAGAAKTTLVPDHDVTAADNGLVLVDGPVSVEVSGFTVDGDASRYQIEGGITYLGGSRGSVHDNVVRNIHFGPYGQGVRLQYASPDVFANTVTDVAETGICIAHAPAGATSETIRIRDNVISGPLQYAITIFDTATISGNTVTNTEKDGIRIDQYDADSPAVRVVVRGNHISYTKFSGIQIGGSSGHLIEGNYLDHTNYYGFDGTGDWDYGGVKLEIDSPGNDIIGNHLSDGIIAIHTWADGTYIANNVISDYGLSYPASKLDLASMRIFRNAAVMVGNNYVPWVYDPVGVVVEENVMDRNAWGLFHSDTLRNVVLAERNWWGSSNGPRDGEGSVEVPTFPVPSLADMANRAPTGVLGADVNEGVTYFPWYLDAERTALVEAVAPPTPVFSDVVVGHPYAAAIGSLSSRNIVNGFGDGTFRPGNPVLRAQFAKMIDLALGLSVTEGGSPLPFRDVERPSNNLYPDDYVAVAYAGGLIKGYPGGLFRPYQDMTRAQLLTMVVRAAEGFQTASLQTPPAGWVGELSVDDPTHGQNIRKAEFSGLLQGIELAGFDIWEKASRGEVAQMLFNLER